jgi:hypothetical protein
VGICWREEKKNQTRKNNKMPQFEMIYQQNWKNGLPRIFQHLHPRLPSKSRPIKGAREGLERTSPNGLCALVD